jgi:DNA-binding IclR family transcriptional regulator
VPKPIQSIARASAVLRLLSGRTRRLGLAELAGELGLPKGTVYGILRTLLSVGFIEQDPEARTYRMGAALLHLGRSYLDDSALRASALNGSYWLAARSSESVRIGAMHDGQVLSSTMSSVPDDRLHVMEVGALLPAHATALGKVLLAHHPYQAAQSIRRELVRFTDATITDPRLLTAELERVQEDGWASELEELVQGRFRSRLRFAIGWASRWGRFPSAGRSNDCVRGVSCVAISCRLSVRGRGRSRATWELFGAVDCLP